MIPVQFPHSALPAKLHGPFLRISFGAAVRSKTTCEQHRHCKDMTQQEERQDSTLAMFLVAVPVEKQVFRFVTDSGASVNTKVFASLSPPVALSIGHWGRLVHLWLLEARSVGLECVT